ncbi:hypothetical protein GKR75_08110 [Providencia sp. wls1919]|nr:hypothetical protein [Providencia sp. wls1919]
MKYTIDITSLWVIALGAWFLIVAHLIKFDVHSAILLAKIIAAILFVFGFYRIIDRAIEYLKYKEQYEIFNEKNKD